MLEMESHMTRIPPIVDKLAQRFLWTEDCWMLEG
jgi:hypothetical protein